jgi:hydrogenase maturation protease
MLTIVGCGNALRGDDGVGPFVARRMRARIVDLGWHDVQAIDAGTDGRSVPFAMRGSDALVIVDTTRTGAEPGTIFQVPGEILARDYTPSINLHDFRWEHALAAGKRMFAAEFAVAIAVLLVEVDETGVGLALSPRVRDAAGTVVDRVLAMAAVYRDANRRASA